MDVSVFLVGGGVFPSLFRPFWFPSEVGPRAEVPAPGGPLLQLHGLRRLSGGKSSRHLAVVKGVLGSPRFNLRGFCRGVKLAELGIRLIAGRASPLPQKGKSSYFGGLVNSPPVLLEMFVGIG